MSTVVSVMVLALLLVFGSYVAWWGQLIMHEAGHHGIRILLNVPTQQVVIGAGPCAFRIKKWTFCLWPIMGQNEPPVYCMDILRWQKTLVLVAGSAANGEPFPLSWKP